MKNLEEPQSPSGGSRPFSPALAIMFAASGCAALIYQLVWFHLLRLVIGASAVSVGIVVSSFMGGMCLGSLAFPRLVSPRSHPLRVYGGLELAIGILGLAVTFSLPLIGRVYWAHAGYGEANLFLRAALGALVLAPPTMLMGATLPAVARWVSNSPAGMARLGLFYGANIFGAVAGCLAASFALLRFYDVYTAAFVAAGLNGAVAAGCLALARRASYKAPLEARGGRGARGGRAWLAYAVAALSGLTALAAEVIWTRQLSLTLGATVYTFAIILAVFLTGLGIGSHYGARLAGRLRRPGLTLGWAQAFFMLALIWGTEVIRHVVPVWRPLYWGEDLSASMHFLQDLVRAGAAMLPAALLWGASFPLAMAAARSGARDMGGTVGIAYAANTVGAIAGSLLATFVGAPRWGTRQSEELLVWAAGAAAVLAFAGGAWRAGRRRAKGDGREAGPDDGRGWEAAVSTFGLAAVAFVGVGLAGVERERITGSVTGAFGVRPPLEADERVFFREGITTTVEVRDYEGRRSLFVNGKVVASSAQSDLRLQRMLAHLPALLHPAPRSVLIVGMGTGATAGAFVLYPSVERIVICEIEPAVMEAARDYFSRENYDALEDPRTEVVFDDARHYMATTREKFDIITSDPIHPWVRGAAALYSLDYYRLAESRLREGGWLTQWIPFYDTDAAAVKTELATFFHAFPGGAFWHSALAGRGDDGVMLAGPTPMRISVPGFIRRANELPGVMESLEETGFSSPVDLLRTFAGAASDFEKRLEGVELNTDASLRLEYLAGLAATVYEPKRVFESIRVEPLSAEEVFMGDWKERVCSNSAEGKRD